MVTDDSSRYYIREILDSLGIGAPDPGATSFALLMDTVPEFL